jgi:hypothetical protein
LGEAAFFNGYTPSVLLPFLKKNSLSDAIFGVYV